MTFYPKIKHKIMKVILEIQVMRNILFKNKVVHGIQMKKSCVFSQTGNPKTWIDVNPQKSNFEKCFKTQGPFYMQNSSFKTFGFFSLNDVTRKFMAFLEFTNFSNFTLQLQT